MKIKTLVSLAFTSALFAACGPGGCVEDVKNCSQICENYQDCQDSNFDRDGCVDQCENRADFDEAFRIAADRCENCLDTGSCEEQADSCAADCDDVINASQ